MSKNILDICRRCGAKCCKGPSPTITIFDIIRILKFLNDRPDSIEKYFEIYTHEYYVKHVLPSRFGIRLSNNVEELLNRRLGDLYKNLLIVKLRKRSDNSCIFLTDDYRCSIYDVRPMACRAYPMKIQGVDNDCLLVQEGIELSEEKVFLEQYIRELVLHYEIFVKSYVCSIRDLVRVVELFWNAVS